MEDLSQYWKAFPSLRSVLFKSSSRTGFSNLKVEQSQIKKTIFEHPDFIKYSIEIDKVLLAWRNKHIPYLKNMVVGVKPKETIKYLSEDLLQKFSDIPLIDNYDIYQSLMNYWMLTMQDDLYQIADVGWKAELSLDEKKKTWDCDLLPKYLVIEKFFQAEKNNIEKLESRQEAIKQQLTELEEEHGGEDGLLANAKNDKDKLDKSSVQRRLKEIKEDDSLIEEIADEAEMLAKYQDLAAEEAFLRTSERKSIADLDKKVAARFKTLTTDEIKSLVVDDKWIATIEKDVKIEVERISQKLSQRIKELAERYETPMPQLTSAVVELESIVNAHLKKMGFKW